LRAYLQSVAQVRNMVREESIDLVHATSAISMQYVLPVAKMRGISAIAHVQGKHLKSSRVGAFIAWADAVVAVSTWISRDYRIAGNRLSIVSDGINTDRFCRNIVERERLRLELGIATDEPVVGMVGQLLPGKRPLLFVDIASVVCTKFPRARFILAGAGELEKDVVAAVEAAGLSGRILVLGYRADVPALLSAMDIFLFTSCNEALGLAPLEAASSGLPVVAGAATALPEVVEDGTTGFLVDPDNVGAYAEKCVQLIEDEALAQRMGAAGREMIFRKFSLEAFRMNIDQLYRRLLQC
ncbi:partial Poly(ribitol-phosphate) alpha-N-acetylglucosaminyltransferase, partial [Anaerolineae bacterium]